MLFEIFSYSYSSILPINILNHGVETSLHSDCHGPDRKWEDAIYKAIFKEYNLNGKCVIC